MKKQPLYNTAHPLAETGKPIFIPFGEWKYDATRRQRLDRAHGEAIANELNARVARGEPGIPVYQGHPDVPELASKYPDKGAMGWVVKIELVNESAIGGLDDWRIGGLKGQSPNHTITQSTNNREGLALTVEWDRDPGKGFKWFSPYWLANERDGSTYIVNEIASIGLVNNPNIPEFRLANEAEDNETKNNERKIMDREKLIQVLGLPPEATDDQIIAAIAEIKKAADDKAAAESRAASAETAETAAKTETEVAQKEADDAKKAFENERKLRAEMALDAAVKDGRIGEGARDTWREKLIKEGAFAALANEKPLSTTDRTKGLVNACGGDTTDHEKRMAMVNEIMAAEKCGYDDAWAKAEKKDPALFGKK